MIGTDPAVRRKQNLAFYQTFLGIMDLEVPTIAAINGPRQCVVSGREEEVEEFEREMEERGEEYRRIEIEVAAHSEMVEPILGRFEEYVGEVEKREPEIRMISNVSGKWLRGEEAKEGRYWRRQLREGVRFWEGLEEIRREVGGVLLEVGPGQNLSRLARMSGRKEEVIVSSMRHAMMEEEEDEWRVKRAVGELWGGGVEIDWEKMNEGEGKRRVEAPGYPFERKRYWIEREEEKEGRRRRGEGKRRDIGEWFYAPVWRQSKRREGRGERKGEGGRIWMILEDEKGKGEEIGRRLRERGEEVVRVKWGEEKRKKGEREYEINGRRREEYEEMVKEVEEIGEGKREMKVVHMWSVREEEGRKEWRERFEEEQERGCYSVMKLAQALMKREGGEEVELSVVMEGVWGVESGEEGKEEKATIVGGAKVIGQEGEGIRCRVIDVKEGGGEEELEGLMKELEGEVEEGEVALRGRKRWVREYEEKRLEGEGELREGGVYVITGGMGGIGLMLGEYITRRAKGKVVLVGRRRMGEMGEEGEEKRRKVEEMKRAGGEIEEIKGDVTNEEEMREVIEKTYERYGRIDGVIHAAGVAGERAINLIREVDENECKKHFSAKAHGVYILKKVLEGKDIDFCLLNSSNASVLGGLGSFSYSSANFFMDAFAENHSESNGMRWTSANWDGWLLEANNRLSASFQTSIDQFAMTPEESTEAFRRIVASGISGQVVVSTGDLPERLDLWIRSRGRQKRNGEDADGPPVPASPRPALGAAYVPPSNEIEQIITKAWQDLLGIDQLGIHDNFFELGGNSLIGLKVISRLKRDLNAEIPMVALFEGSTVSRLSKLISRNGYEAVDFGANRSRGERRREKTRLRRSSQSGQV